MDELLAAIATLVSRISSEKITAVAAHVRRTDPFRAVASLRSVVSTPEAAAQIERLVAAWRSTKVGSDELASMLLAASYVNAKAASEHSIELVWTGPTTPFVSARRTEQALLEVINSAEASLFITSFVAYEVSAIVKALNAANDRGVIISMLLELSKVHGGSISFDAIGNMRKLVPAAALYAWSDKADPFIEGCVHAKIAVADSRICFITSANLTGHAMEKNMEAGLLMSGGRIPALLSHHLSSLIAMKVVSLI